MSYPAPDVFVGREQELADLMAFSRKAFSGDASVGFITGEAGIGKTTLAERMFRKLYDEYEDVVIAKTQCTVSEVSYLPFQTLLKALLSTDRCVPGKGKKSRRVVEIVMEAIWDVGPEVIGVFGIPIKLLQVVVDQLGWRERKELPNLSVPKNLDQGQVFGWYAKVMTDIAEQLPLVLFIDDLHWADDSSLNLLRHLGRVLEQQRLCVIGTYRPHQSQSNPLLLDMRNVLVRHGAREFLLNFSQSTSGEQDKANVFVATYLQERYGTIFSARFKDLLADKTEGNPFFLTEILTNLEEQGRIIRTELDEWQMTAPIERIEQLPERVESVIRERVDRLETSLRNILNIASVQGDEFLVQIIASVEQMDEWELSEQLADKLVTGHQLVIELGEHTLANGNCVDTFAFRHSLLREYLYADLQNVTMRLRLLHGKIGEALEQLYAPDTHDMAAALAVHFFHARNQEKCMEYALKTAQIANRSYGASESLRFGQMGLQALEQRRNAYSLQEFAAHNVQFLIELAQAEGLGGNPQQEKDHVLAGISYLAENLDVVEQVSESLQAKAYEVLGELYSKKDNFKKDAQHFLELALQLSQKHGDKQNEAKILYQLGYNVYNYIPTENELLSPNQKSFQALKASLSLSEALHDQELQALCLSHLGWRCIDEAMFQDAEHYASRAVSLSKNSRTPNRYAEIHALITMARVAVCNSRYKTAIKYAQEGLELSRRIGDCHSEALLLNNLALYSGYYVSSWEQQDAGLKESLSLREKAGYEKIVPLLNLGWLALRRGQWRQAEANIQKAISDSSQSRHSRYRNYLGQLYLAQERYVEAEREFTTSLDLYEIYQRPIDLPDLTSIALCYALTGDFSRCRHYVENFWELFNQNFSPDRKSQYLYKVAEVYRMLGDLTSAKQYCEQALTLYFEQAEDAEELRYVAEARLVLGKVLVYLAEFKEAISILHKAKAAFEVYGHYQLGETLLYLSKAHQGIGGQGAFVQAKAYAQAALAEFTRLELALKQQEAHKLLETIELERDRN